MKEIELLKLFREENVPHAIIFTEESVDGVVFTGKALLIPSYMRGYRKYGFLYVTQVHDKTAEKDLQEISIKDLQEIGEYRLKMKNDNGFVFQWDKHDFKKTCDYCTIYNRERITHLNHKDTMIWKELIESGGIPSIKNGRAYHIDPDDLLKEEYLDKFLALKRKSIGFDLFGGDTNSDKFDLFEGEL